MREKQTEIMTVVFDPEKHIAVGDTISLSITDFPSFFEKIGHVFPDNFHSHCGNFTVNHQGLSYVCAKISYDGRSTDEIDMVFGDVDEHTLQYIKMILIPLARTITVVSPDDTARMWRKRFVR